LTARRSDFGADAEFSGSAISQRARAKRCQTGKIVLIRLQGLNDKGEMVGPTERHCFRPDAFAKARAALRGKAAASLARIRRLIMRVSTNVAVVRVMAAAVFIGAAGLLVQSFAEGEQDEEPSAAGKISVAKAMAAAGEAAFPDFLVAPVRVRTVKVPAPEGGPSVPAGSDPRWARADLG
jgi:hypothetical protein